MKKFVLMLFVLLIFTNFLQAEEEDKINPNMDNLIESDRLDTKGNGEIGKFDKKTGKLIEGRRISKHIIEKSGIFDEKTGHLISGDIQYFSGKLKFESGTFDPKSGKLIEGVRKTEHPDINYSYIEESGKYDIRSGYLTEGYYDYSSNYSALSFTGSFDPKTGNFMEGRLVQSNTEHISFISEGKFDIKTRKLKEGKKTTLQYRKHINPDLEPLELVVLEGKFDSKTGNLVEGTMDFNPPNDDEAFRSEGIFDSRTGNLIKGMKKYAIETKLLEGIFDPKNGNLVEGKLTLNYRHDPGLRIEEGKFDSKTGKLKNGTVTYEDGNIVVYKNGEPNRH